MDELLYGSSLLAGYLILTVMTRSGIITKEDLASYKPTLYEEMTNNHFRGDLVMCGGPPPASFSVTQLIVSVMSGELLDP
ncbi:unnamed protein product [Strongylus vulgaris]|uniref:Uncharacterized protein n=1 Tax=Strongylus vulgaris TaxID=40348 RepID=A0A3P7IYC8_STRVU|nr:unnamed protein product [Strongylus vulgaris]